jgi:hypothetical protein
VSHTKPVSVENPRASYAPDPFYLEIISTLLVHPQFTTQRSEDDRIEIPSRSITLLRNVLAILGPLNANLAEAFSFIPLGGRRYRRGRNNDNGESSGSDDDEERIKGIAANHGRVRVCAKDFWHVVGWALNCSVVYPKRWKYWKVWLDYMLDVLDADWEERERMDNNAAELSMTGARKEVKPKNLRESLLVKYLSDVQGSAALKRVVGSIFADGGADDLTLYPEVFPNETKEIKVKHGQKRKRSDDPDWIFDCPCGEYGQIDDGTHSIPCDTCNRWQHSLCAGVNIAEAERADFYFTCSACTSAPSDQSIEMPSSQATEASNDGGEVEPDPMLGGAEAMALRQRLICNVSLFYYILEFRLTEPALKGCIYITRLLRFLERVISHLCR